MLYSFQPSVCLTNDPASCYSAKENAGPTIPRGWDERKGPFFVGIVDSCVRRCACMRDCLAVAIRLNPFPYCSKAKRLLSLSRERTLVRRAYIRSCKQAFRLPSPSLFPFSAPLSSKNHCEPPPHSLAAECIGHADFENTSRTKGCSPFSEIHMSPSGKPPLSNAQALNPRRTVDR